MNNFSENVNFLWSIAELLRDTLIMKRNFEVLQFNRRMFPPKKATKLLERLHRGGIKRVRQGGWYAIDCDTGAAEPVRRTRKEGGGYGLKVFGEWVGGAVLV